MSPPETEIRSRQATQDDLPILWDFLAIAAYEPDADAAKAVPFVAAHLAGWQRPEDFGFIAERDGTAIGAAWARQFARDEQPAFFVDERTPEITTGVKPHIRGRGVGGMLLQALFADAARRRLCLNVRHDNPARRLYERVGFRLVPGSGVPNRAGGTSFGMVWGAPPVTADTHHSNIPPAQEPLSALQGGEGAPTAQRREGLGGTAAGE